jgi:hypothetical protein
MCGTICTSNPNYPLYLVITKVITQVLTPSKGRPSITRSGSSSFGSYLPQPTACSKELVNVRYGSRLLLLGNCLARTLPACLQLLLLRRRRSSGSAALQLCSSAALQEEEQRIVVSCPSKRGPQRAQEDAAPVIKHGRRPSCRRSSSLARTLSPREVRSRSAAAAHCRVLPSQPASCGPERGQEDAFPNVEYGLRASELFVGKAEVGRRLPSASKDALGLRCSEEEEDAVGGLVVVVPNEVSCCSWCRRQQARAATTAPSSCITVISSLILSFIVFVFRLHSGGGSAAPTLSCPRRPALARRPASSKAR